MLNKIKLSTDWGFISIYSSMYIGPGTSYPYLVYILWHVRPEETQIN